MPRPEGGGQASPDAAGLLARIGPSIRWPRCRKTMLRGHFWARTWDNFFVLSHVFLSLEMALWGGYLAAYVRLLW